MSKTLITFIDQGEAPNTPGGQFFVNIKVAIWCHLQSFPPLDHFPWSTFASPQPKSHLLVILCYLVGGIPTPLKNMSQMGWWHSQDIGKVIKFHGSKPPTSCKFLLIVSSNPIDCPIIGGKWLITMVNSYSSHHQPGIFLIDWPSSNPHGSSNPSSRPVTSGCGCK